MKSRFPRTLAQFDRTRGLPSTCPGAEILPGVIRGETPEGRKTGDRSLGLVEVHPNSTPSDAPPPPPRKGRKVAVIARP